MTCPSDAKVIEREKEPEITPKYSNEFICKVLRTDLKSNLWNKTIKTWTTLDWSAFEKLKNEKLKSIQVNY